MMNKTKILAALEAAKKSALKDLNLISGPELLAQIQQIKPDYTKQALYKWLQRHPETPAQKVKDTWYFDRTWAEAHLAKIKVRPSSKKQSS